MGKECHDADATPDRHTSIPAEDFSVDSSSDRRWTCRKTKEMQWAQADKDQLTIEKRPERWW
jgi:hypothetical protein